MLLSLVWPTGWLLAGWIAGAILTTVAASVSTDFSIRTEENCRAPWDFVIVTCEMCAILLAFVATVYGTAILVTVAYDRVGIALCWFAGFELMRCLWFVFRLETAPRFGQTSRSELWGSRGRIG